MVDIHCHIVPDVDDGAWDLDAAVEMARMAADCGIRRVIATPHFTGVSESLEGLNRMIRQFRRLQSALKREVPGLELIPGAEILCVPQTLELARRGQLPTLGDSRYVLTEFYVDAPWELMDSTLSQLRRCGYWPVVAHPERYDAVQRDVSRAQSWFRRGYVIQVNKGSVLGAFGHRAEETAIRLLSRGCVHVIATDAHSPEVRTTDLSRVRLWLKDHFGREYTQILLEDNPERISRGMPMRSIDSGE